MASAQLNEEGVDRPNLNSAPAALIPDLGCFDVIFSIWLEKR